MNAIHAVWSEVRVPQLNRLLKNFGVRLIQTRSKKWGDKSTITGSYIDGGLPFAAKAIVAAKANDIGALETHIKFLEQQRDSLLDAIQAIDDKGKLNEYNILSAPECEALVALFETMRPPITVEEEALELN